MTWRFDQRAVSVSFCCNNPDTGMFTGRFGSVEIGEEILHLTNSRRVKDPRISFDLATPVGGGWGASPVAGTIKVARQKFPILGYKYGWGNWCWDLVMMLPEDVIDLLNCLKRMNCFTPECGETRWFNFFEAEDAVFDRDDKNGWIRMLEKWGYQNP